MSDREKYLREYETELTSLANTAAFDKQMAILTAECAEAAALVEDCIAANAASALNQEDYQKRYDELVARYDVAKAQLDALKQNKLERAARKEKIGRFLKTMRRVKHAPDVFDEKLWRETVEAMTVHTLQDVAVRFYSGTEIHVSATDASDK